MSIDTVAYVPCLDAPQQNQAPLTVLLEQTQRQLQQARERLAQTQAEVWQLQGAVLALETLRRQLAAEDS